MVIRWIGQSGYILNDGQTKLVIDPYLSDAVNRIAGRPRMVPPPISPEDLRADAVFCTHDHLDHLDPDAILRMDREHTLFIAPSACVPHLQELGCLRIHVLDEGESMKIGAFTLMAVFAAHTVPAVGALVRHGMNTLYFTGDTQYDTRLEEIRQKSIDLLFVCINGQLGNMDLSSAVKLAGIIHPRAAVPAHYGMFESNTADPTDFTARVAKGFEMQLGRGYTLGEILEGASCFAN